MAMQATWWGGEINVHSTEVPGPVRRIPTIVHVGSMEGREIKNVSGSGIR